MYDSRRLMKEEASRRVEKKGRNDRGDRGDARHKSEDREEKDQKRKRSSKWDADTFEPTAAPMPSMPTVMMEPMLLKPALCVNFVNGHCTRGDACVEAHSLRELAPGGIKPRLCPDFMLPGGCPRQTMCLYAHSREELPGGYKVTLCTRYVQGNCASAKMCKRAHGEQEKAWFTEFMQPPGEVGLQPGGDEQRRMATEPKASGTLSGPLPVGLRSVTTGAADLTNSQARLGLTPAMPFVPKRPKAPSYTPRLNLAKLPATMKAPALLQALAETQTVAAMMKRGGVFAKGASALAAPGLTTSMGKASPQPPVMASPPVNPKAASMLDRIAALQQAASRGVCLQFQMGKCTGEGCLLAHEIS